MVTIGLAATLLALQARVSWEPKTKLLPTPFVKTAQFLLAHGMPDPRGHEARKFKRQDVMILEESSPTRQILWLSADGQSAFDLAGLGLSPKLAGDPESLSNYLPRMRLSSDESSFYPRSGDAISIVLLAVHGEEEIAARFLNYAKMAGSTPSSMMSYFAMSSFLFNRYQQAVVNFQMAKDEAALQQFQWLEAEWPKFESFAAANFTFRQAPELYFSSLGMVNKFKSDLLRRKKRGSKAPLSLSAIASQPIQKQIALLIDSLDEVKRTDHRFFSTQSRTERRLVQIGKVAVTQLLTALQNETRLTRVEPQHDHTFAHYEVLPVKTLILRILMEIAWIPRSQGVGEDAIKEYWSKNLDKPEPRRMYDALKASLAPGSMSFAWREACRALLQDDMHPELPFAVGSPDREHARRVSVRSEMQPALKFSDPSISEILMAGVERRATSGEGPGLGGGDIVSALELAQISYYWDPAHSLEALQMASRKYLLAVSINGNKMSFGNELFGFVLDARKALGDKTYLTNVADLVESLTSFDNAQSLEQAKYFLDRIDDPVVASFAEKLLFDKGSGYNVEEYLKRHPMDLGVLGSPILAFAEGRALVQSVIEDKKPYSREQLDGAGLAGIYLNQIDENGTFGLIPYNQVRPCDLTARALWRIKGCPEFELKWPLKKRDQALIKVRRFFDHLDAKKLEYRYPWTFGSAN